MIFLYCMMLVSEALLHVLEIKIVDSYHLLQSCVVKNWLMLIAVASFIFLICKQCKI